MDRCQETLLPPPLRQDTMDTFIDLRTPSYMYNHGGYYAPGDPRDCNTPGGPCCYCQDRIDQEAAAEALILLSKTCCTGRADFMEPCPECNQPAPKMTHADVGLTVCNGCSDNLCTNCFTGARYFCPLRLRMGLGFLPAPSGPLQRQEALGVQSPKVEEKRENK